MKDTLTPKQTEILDYILGCWRKGYIPTQHEIAEEFDRHQSGMVHHIMSLRIKGYLDCASSRIALTPKAMAKAKHV